MFYEKAKNDPLLTCQRGKNEKGIFVSTTYIQLLEKQKEIDHKSVFIDVTKIESRAGRYTFNWRGTA